MTKDASPLALVTCTEHEQKSRKCFFCGKAGQIAPECQLKNTGRERQEGVVRRKCLKSKETGHIAKYCSKKGENGDTTQVSGILVLQW